MRPFLLLPLLLFASASSLAHAEVYKCIGADARVTYTNDPTLARNCVRLQSDQTVSSVPAPVPHPAAGAAPAPAFPRVNPADQRARDDTRRQVLENELSTEESALTAAEKALAEQEAVRFGNERNYQKVLDRLQPFKDKVELHKRNIEALRREISALR